MLPTGIRSRPMTSFEHEGLGTELDASRPDVEPGPTVPDVLPISVPRGGKVLVFSGLRLEPGGTDVSREAARALVRALEDCRGPGVAIFAGDTFDMLEGRPDPSGAITAHP